MLSQSIIEEIIATLEPGEEPFLVGGQATNFWAERYYDKDPGLAAYSPFNSKDIDFFGSYDAASKLAKTLGGTVRRPAADDHSPQTAVVSAVVQGTEVEIDFLWNVIGPPKDDLASKTVKVDYPLTVDGVAGSVPLRIMHPLHCRQSRASNIITLGRRDEVSKRQLNAAVLILRAHISEVLEDSSAKNKASSKVTQAILSDLTHYLTKDIVGAQLHNRTATNPIEIIKAFRDDPRLDERFRDNQVQSMIESISTRQARDRNRMLQARQAQGIGF